MTLTTAPCDSAPKDAEPTVGQITIVHVVRQFWPGVGGFENYVAELARHQAALGHRVRVVTLNRIFHSELGRLPAREQHQGYEIRRIPYRGSARYPIAPGVLREITDADLIHVHAIDFFADFLALTKPLHRKPMVISTHGGFFHTGFARRLKQVYFHTITRCSLAAYHTVIPSSVQDAQSFATIRRTGLVTIENGVDIDKFAGLSDRTAKVMLYFGRIAPNKELPRLIRWFAAFHRHAPDWRLIIAGKAMGVSWQSIEAVITDEGLADFTELHNQPDDAKLAQLIARSSVYVCASSYEGFGIAAVEAASAGLFPVLSNIEPFERTVAQTGLGMVVDFDAPPEAGLVVARLHDNRSKGGENPLFSALAPFGWAAKHRQIMNIYASMLMPHLSHTTVTSV